MQKLKICAPTLSGVRVANLGDELLDDPSYHPYLGLEDDCARHQWVFAGLFDGGSYGRPRYAIVCRSGEDSY